MLREQREARGRERGEVRSKDVHEGRAAQGPRCAGRGAHLDARQAYWLLEAHLCRRCALQVRPGAVLQGCERGCNALLCAEKSCLRREEQRAMSSALRKLAHLLDMVPKAAVLVHLLEDLHLFPQSRRHDCCGMQLKLLVLIAAAAAAAGLLNRRCNARLLGQHAPVLLQRRRCSPFITLQQT